MKMLEAEREGGGEGGGSLTSRPPARGAAIKLAWPLGEELPRIPEGIAHLPVGHEPPASGGDRPLPGLEHAGLTFQQSVRPAQGQPRQVRRRKSGRALDAIDNLPEVAA